MINDKMKIIAEQQSQRVVLKGNTIKYNNLVQNGNFTNTSGWSASNVNFTTSNNVATLKTTNTGWCDFYQKINSVLNNKYLLLMSIKTSRASYSFALNWGTQLLRNYATTTTEWEQVGVIFTRNDISNARFNLSSYASNVGDIVNFKDIHIIDLTALGLSVSTLTDLYATDLGKFIQNGNYLPYSANNTIYSVKSPFIYKGRNLINYKTTYDNTCFELVGNVLKNIVVDQRHNGRISFSIYSWTYGSVGSLNIETNGRFAIELHPTQSGEYNFYHSGSSTNIYITKFYLIGGETYTLSLDVISHDSRVVGGFEIANIQLEKGNEATPYLAYDNQLTYIRTKRVDLGTLNWTYHSRSGGYDDYFDTYLSNDCKVGDSNTEAYIKCGKYETIKSRDIAVLGSQYTDNVMALANLSTRLIICDKNYTNTNDLKQALTGVILEYETAEPLELNGIGTNYDTFSNHDGKVVRKIRKVKINDINWSKVGSEFRVTITSIKSHSGTSVIPQVLCTGYEVVSPLAYQLGSQVLTQDTKVIKIKDNTYQSVADFKSAKGNEYIYYITTIPENETERSVLVDHRYNKIVDVNNNEIDYTKE